MSPLALVTGSSRGIGQGIVLATGLRSYSAGQVFNVDGGFHIHRI